MTDAERARAMRMTAERLEHKANGILGEARSHADNLRPEAKELRQRATELGNAEHRA